jgi:hypothetical protein
MSNAIRCKKAQKLYDVWKPTIETCPQCGGRGHESFAKEFLVTGMNDFVIRTLERSGIALTSEGWQFIATPEKRRQRRDEQREQYFEHVFQNLTELAEDDEL